MGKVVKSVFGGKDSSAQKGQTAQNAAAREFIEERGAQAREDILRLAPAADENRNLGFSSAIDVISRSAPQQVAALQGGSRLAQGNLVQGLDNATRAILGIGGGTQFQPTSVGANLNMFEGLALPNFTTAADALSSPSFERQSVRDNINTDADLFAAASRGDIPDISKGDQKFFGDLLAGGDFSGNRFTGETPFTGNAGGLSADNEKRLANLLRQFRRL